MTQMRDECERGDHFATADQRKAEQRGASHASFRVIEEAASRSAIADHE